MAPQGDPETAEHAGLIFLLYLSHIGQTQVSHFCDGNAGYIKNSILVSFW